MGWKIFVVVALLTPMLSGCMKPKEEGLRAEELGVNLVVKRHNEYYIVCEASFADLENPTSPVLLEDDAILSCNGVPMVKDSVGYYLFVEYQAGLKVTLSVFRPVNGSSYSTTQSF